MSTIVTRQLGKADRFDRRAVRVDALDFKDKSGVIEITLTNYQSGGSLAGGTVDIRVPNYNPDNDDIVANAVLGSSPATVTLGTKLYVAVNKGFVGPSARVNPDGTWDLLDLTLTLPEGNTLTDASVSLTYSVNFIDLTPSTTNPTSGNQNLDLSVGPDKHTDAGAIGVLNSTIGSSSGYVKAWINQASTVVISDGGDSYPPSFGVFGTQGASGCACNGSNSLTLLRHRLSKISGSKTYSQAMFVFAVNNGKIDANGTPNKGTNSQSVALECKLDQDDSAKDIVNLSVNFNVSFQAL